MGKKLVHWFLSGYDSPARYRWEPLAHAVFWLAVTFVASAYYLIESYL